MPSADPVPGQESSARGEEERFIRGVLPSRLAAQTEPGAVRQFTELPWQQHASDVASTWQGISAVHDSWELILVPTVQPGRASELAGLIASGGEQLGLALAALNEAELWTLYRAQYPADPSTLDGRSIQAAQEMSQRAMADLAVHYLLATGHIVANVTARTLALDARLHPVLLDVLGTWNPPGSATARDWLSLNRDTVRSLRRAAGKSALPAHREVAIPATGLVQSPAWQELDQLRGMDYHRRRPQSAGISGVPLANPWQQRGSVISMNGGGGQYDNGDGLARATAEVAQRAAVVTARAMKALLTTVEAVVSGINDLRS
jgi:hypothetical protein